MKSEQPTVFVIDDDAMVRQALILLLECEGMAAEGYASADEFLDAYRPEQAGCVVLDMDMPGLNGLELQATLVERDMHIPIIFLTGQADVPKTAQAFKAGAIDLLEKPASDKKLLESISKALAYDERRRETDRLQSMIMERMQRLTPREKEVMSLIVAGRSNKEVAKALDISHRTAEGHRQRVLEKMQADSLPELVTMAQTCGISPEIT